jgi:hypothetical protein
LKKIIDFRQTHPEGQIVTMDELSLYLQASLTRVWFPKGQTPVVRVSQQRDHQHFYGALNLTTGQKLALSLPELSAQATLHFLDKLALAEPVANVSASYFSALARDVTKCPTTARPRQNAS